MTTQAKLDAACAAVKPLVDADLQGVEGQISIFARRQAEQAIETHRVQIDAGVRQLLNAGIDAAATVA